MASKPKTLNQALKKYQASAEDAQMDKVNAKKYNMSLSEYKKSDIDKRNDLKGAKKTLKGK